MGEFVLKSNKNNKSNTLIN